MRTSLIGSYGRCQRQQSSENGRPPRSLRGHTEGGRRLTLVKELPESGVLQLASFSAWVDERRIRTPRSGGVAGTVARILGFKSSLRHRSSGKWAREAVSDVEEETSNGRHVLS
jgi:hypothetical protein